ncbi:hypothetical protein ACTXT7_003538 [Hymenolepis weldensis]
MSRCRSLGMMIDTRLDLAVFNSKDYAQASASFNQRKDKPLAGFRPCLSISFPRPITWICVNSSGSLLLIAFDTSIQLLNAQQLSAQPPHGVVGNPLEIPAAEGSIHDLAWNPVDKHRFALVTSSGSVRMFSVSPLQQPHINSVGNLPPNVQAHCHMDMRGCKSGTSHSGFTKVEELPKSYGIPCSMLILDSVVGS